ncbi:hypothetical protein BD310DRAFT_353717 [Dichomitus squalens]|uniref:Uncharacterized protein n=1 Tax=Dichomitus squalens TaxID=114155 RepID=A0A4Q9PEK1_9APHY|nr:hypothetical protein BD310DRAFT_353717 [Dichomitus squalens]
MFSEHPLHLFLPSQSIYAVGRVWMSTIAHDRETMALASGLVTSLSTSVRRYANSHRPENRPWTHRGDALHNHPSVTEHHLGCCRSHCSRAAVTAHNTSGLWTVRTRTVRYPEHLALDHVDDGWEAQSLLGRGRKTCGEGDGQWTGFGCVVLSSLVVRGVNHRAFRNHLRARYSGLRNEYFCCPQR